jgi:transposase
MKYIEGKDRQQMVIFATTMNDAISAENEVRLIDLFVSSLPMAELGFRMDYIENGRPAYHPGDLLKLYIYGYLNRIRSSRALERECMRNIEVMWLINGLVPDHNTISNFRRDNPKAIRKVFQATVKVARNFDLIGGKLLAGDSTKLRAQNSKKNNFNPRKIEHHLEYIDKKLEEYSSILASEDQDSHTCRERQQMEEKVKKHQDQKQKYESMQQQLEESGDTQISTTDPESRQLITRNNITEVAYNVQTTVDARHSIPIDYKVTNQNDSKAMGGMVRRAKIIVGNNEFRALYDKGYHTGSEFAYADNQGIEVIVAVPDVASHAPDQAFDVEHFKYDKTSDTYTCPANETLITNGGWYNKSRGKSINKIKQYTSKACKSCELRARCTNNKSGRMIERSEHADLINANKQRHEKLKAIYRRRQAIVEHPYGIIKRQWGFNYIITKRTMKRASADVGLIFTAYNLRRLMNLIDIEVLRSYLLALLVQIGSFLTSLELFQRTQNSKLRFFTPNINALQLKINDNLACQFFNNPTLKGGC